MDADTIFEIPDGASIVVYHGLHVSIELFQHFADCAEAGSLFRFVKRAESELGEKVITVERA